LDLTLKWAVQNLPKIVLHLLAGCHALAFDAIDQPVNPGVLRHWRGASIFVKCL